MVKHLSYIIFILLSSLLLSLLFPFVPSDFYPTSISAHAGFLSILGLEDNYNVSILKPASFYYIFYFLVFPILKNTLTVISLYIYFYFILWGLVVLYSLSYLKKLNPYSFLAAFLLSLNESLIYGVASFIYSLIYLIASYIILLKLKNSKSLYLIFVFISLFVFYFIHPYSFIIFSFMSVYIYFSGSDVYKDKIRFLFILFFYSILLSLSIVILSLIFSYAGSSPVTTAYLAFAKSHPLEFLYHLFVERKVAHFIFQTISRYDMYILLFSYFFVFSKISDKDLGLIFLVFIVMLIVPEFFPTTHSFGWRFIPSLLILLLFMDDGINHPDIAFKLILLFLLVSTLAFLYIQFFQPNSYFIPLRYSESSYSFDSTYRLIMFVIRHNYKNVALLSTQGLQLPVLIHYMDEFNLTYSYSYSLSSHPVSPRRGISCLDEIKFIELYHSNFSLITNPTSDQLIEKIVDHSQDLCSNYDVFVYPYYALYSFDNMTDTALFGYKVALYNCSH